MRKKLKIIAIMCIAHLLTVLIFRLQIFYQKTPEINYAILASYAEFIRGISPSGIASMFTNKSDMQGYTARGGQSDVPYLGGDSDKVNLSEQLPSVVDPTIVAETVSFEHPEKAVSVGAAAYPSDHHGRNEIYIKVDEGARLEKRTYEMPDGTVMQVMIPLD